MDPAGIRDLKVLFLISNAVCGVGYGTLLFAFGVGNAATVGISGWYIACIVIGFIIAIFSLCGCNGALSGSKKKLHIYMWGMGLLSIAEITYVIIQSNVGSQLDDVLVRAHFVALIFFFIITVVSISLAIMIVCRIAKYEAIVITAELAAKIIQKNGIAPEVAAKIIKENGMAPELAAIIIQNNGIAPELAVKIIQKIGIAPELDAKIIQKNNIAPELAAKKIQKKNPA